MPLHKGNGDDMELIGYYRIHNSAQRDNWLKLRWIILNDKQNENTQVQANMTVVHNILNGGIGVKHEDIILGELAVAA